jgi:hypothetical protein
LPATGTTGITTTGEVEIAPVLMVRRFGLPSHSDGYKVSGEYVLVDEEGRPFVVHDWKSTSLWDNSFPTPEEFWANEQPQELCIGTRDLDTAEFERWLFLQLGVEPAESGPAP